MVCGQIVGLVLALALENVLGDSPCPGVFQYQADSTGLPYGLITIPVPESNLNLKLEVIMGLDAVLPTQYAGRIELVGDKTEVWGRLLTGSKQPIQYRLYFPLSWPLPIVKQISLNGNIFCFANPQPTVTKLALDHSLRPVLPSGYQPQIDTNKNNQWNNIQVYRPLDQHYPPPPPSVPSVESKFIVIPSQQTGGYQSAVVRPPPVDAFVKPNRPVPDITNVRPPPRTTLPTTTTTTEAAVVPISDECGISIAAPLPLVYNGLPTEKGEWPWLVAMFVKSKSGGLQFQCGASLLSTTIVLTAAHCVKYRGRPEVPASAIVLFLGKFNLQEWTDTSSQVRDVETVHIHPDYQSNDGMFEADLAILVLKEVVQYTLYVRPICLWIFSTDVNQIIGQTGTAVGWGKDERGTQNTKPRKISMPIVSHGDCILSNKEFVYYVTNRTFCAGKKDGTGPCSGDSGGGFMIGYQEGRTTRWYLRGVIHLSLLDKESMECDLHNYLIYTDVAVFMDWIRTFVTD